LPTIIAVAAAALALGALIALWRFARRQSRPAAPPVEIDDLRRQLEEAQRGAALREELVLAEYEMKISQWEAEGYDVREVRALLDQHKASRSAAAAGPTAAQPQPGRADGRRE
jgi:hypothetical protein